MSQDVMPGKGSETIEGPLGSYRREASGKVLEGSGFHPPAIVLVACGLVAAGLFLILIGTPVLKLPSGHALSTGESFVKILLGLILIGAGGGLYWLKAWSLPAARFLILIGGVLVPLYHFQSSFIDWEFLVTGRIMLLLTSVVVLAYLMRGSVAHAFRSRGVPVRFESYYCAGCNAPHPRFLGGGCPHCGGPLHRLYRSPGGVAYAPYFDGGLCSSCGEELRSPDRDSCPACGKGEVLLLYRFPGGARLAVEV